MKKPIRYGLIFLWMLFATLTLTKCWLSYPEKFVTFPQSWALALVNFFDNTGKEDIELLLGLFMSLIVVTIVTISIYLIWQKLNHQPAHSQQNI